MIIKRVHIDKFGKFDDYTIDFGDRCNVVYGSNEDGKSTVMNFVKMMFYGNPGRSGDISKNVRKRYQPWNGAKMSGYIEFESKGTPYKLIRSFGNTNATDKITLWNLASGEEESLPMKTEPGLKFFGIGAAAFEKSVFIGQIGSLEDATFENDKDDEITQKLLNLVSTGDETVSHKKVDARLQSARESFRSKRGKIGILDKNEQAITALTSELNRAKADEEAKGELVKRIDDLKREIEDITRDVENKKLELELQELLTQLEAPRRIIANKSRIIEMEKEFNKQSDYLDSFGIDISGEFEKSCEEAIDNRKTAEELYDERSRALAIKSGALDKLKAIELPDITDETVEEIKSLETEANGLRKDMEEAKDKANSVRIFLEKREAADEISESIRKNAEQLDRELNAKSKAESRLEDAKAALEAARIKLEGQEAAVEAREAELSQARGDYRIAMHNTSSIKDLNNQKLDAAKERVRQAEIPNVVSTTETKPAKPSMALIIVALVLAVASVYLGMTSNPIFYSGLAVSAATLLFAFSRKETVTRTSSSADEEEIRLSRENLDVVQRQAETDLSVSMDEEAKAKQHEEMLEVELKAENEKLAEASVVHKAASDEWISADKELNLVLNSLKHLQEASDNLAAGLAEKEKDIEKLGFSASAEEYESLGRNLEGMTERLGILKGKIEGMLLSFGCRTTDEFKALYSDSKNRKESILEKENDARDAADLADEARKAFEDSTGEFISLIRKYTNVSDFESGMAEYMNLKSFISRIKDLRNRIDGQNEMISKEQEGRSIDEIDAEINGIIEEIKSRNNGEIPLKMSEHGIETLKSEFREQSKNEKKLSVDLVMLESEVRNKFKDRKNVSQVEDEINMLKSEIKAAEDYYETIEIAQDVLMDSFNEIRQSFGPLLNSKTADIFGKLTGGRYKNVMITRNFDINVQDSTSSEMREWKYLSSGTVDQAYLSLRLAVSDLLNSSAEELPVLLDDVFIQYDDDRARKGLEFLADYYNGGESSPQVILFTCHRRIVDWAENGVKDISVSYLA